MLAWHAGVQLAVRAACAQQSGVTTADVHQQLAWTCMHGRSSGTMRCALEALARIAQRSAASSTDSSHAVLRKLWDMQLALLPALLPGATTSLNAWVGKLILSAQFQGVYHTNCNSQWPHKPTKLYCMLCSLAAAAL